MKSTHKAALLALGVVLAAGCRQDMHNQPKYKPLRASEFFRDGSSARPLVDGTIARGTLQEDEAFFTGKSAGQLVREMPFAIDEAVLARGQERYAVFCTPCHDATGSGNGMIVQRGYRKPPPMYDERLRNAEAGYLFDVITNGFGAMPDYRTQISPRDRWAVVAYVRALQASYTPGTGAAPAAPTQAPAPATAKPGGHD